MTPSFATGSLDELGCALVLADGGAIAVLTEPPTDPAVCDRFLRSVRGLPRQEPGAIGFEAIALLGGGSESCDLTFQPLGTSSAHAVEPGPPEVAVACAVVARLTGRLLPDRVVVASNPGRSVRLRLISPLHWWSGDWIVARPQQPSRRIAARLVFHGALVVS